MKTKILVLLMILFLVLFTLGCNQQITTSSDKGNEQIADSGIEQKQTTSLPESKDIEKVFFLNKTIFAVNNNIEIKVISYKYETYYEQKVLRVDLKLTNKGSKEFHFFPGDSDRRSKAVDVEGHEYDIIQDGTLYLNDIVYPLNSVEGYLLFGKTENTPKIDHILLGLGWYDKDPIKDLFTITI